MADARYVPPAKRFAGLRRLTLEVAGATEASHILQGSHMNPYGGSWSTNHIASRIQDSQNDWDMFDAGHSPPGFHWAATTGAGTVIAVVAFYRPHADNPFAHIIYFAPHLATEMKEQIARAAVEAFAGCIHGEAVVDVLCPLHRGEFQNVSVFERAGFTSLVVGNVLRKNVAQRRDASASYGDLDSRWGHSFTFLRQTLRGSQKDRRVGDASGVRARRHLLF